MKTLQISQLKPNPAGKDRTRFGPGSPTQLAGEWVDVKNTGTAPINLENVELNHKAFSPQDPAGRWQAVMVFPKFSLPAGNVVRVHSGKHRDVSVIGAADQAGADYHAFTGADAYIWNNRDGDTAALWDVAQQKWIDGAAYDPNSPEGVILVRLGSKLIPLVPSFANALRRSY
jgi:hypothetical protein